MMHHTALHIVAISNVALGLVLLLSIFLGKRIPLVLRQLVGSQAVGLIMMGMGTLLQFGPYDDAGTLLSIAGGIITIVAVVRYMRVWQAGKLKA